MLSPPGTGMHSVGTRPPTGYSVIDEMADGLAAFTGDNAEKFKKLRVKRQEELQKSVIASAYEKEAARVARLVQEEERNLQLGDRRRLEAQAEEALKNERKLEMLAMQKQEIQREMARKERERVRRKQEQMGSTFCDLSNPESFSAFPIEPDPEPLKQARLQQRNKLKDALKEQVEAVEKEKVEQKERETAAHRALMAKLEKETEIQFMQQESERLRNSHSLAKAWNQQMAIRELQGVGKKSPVRQRPRGTTPSLNGPREGTPVSVRTFEMPRV